MSQKSSVKTNTKTGSFPEVVLEVKNLTKRFPGVLANDSVNLEVRRGETHGLLGENGAGKTTLAECIFGYYKYDSGKESFIKAPHGLKESHEFVSNLPALLLKFIGSLLYKHFG